MDIYAIIVDDISDVYENNSAALKRYCEIKTFPEGQFPLEYFREKECNSIYNEIVGFLDNNIEKVCMIAVDLFLDNPFADDEPSAKSVKMLFKIIDYAREKLGTRYDEWRNRVLIFIYTRGDSVQEWIEQKEKGLWNELMKNEVTILAKKEFGAGEDLFIVKIAKSVLKGLSS